MVGRNPKNKKVALITGAAKNLGREIAITLAENDFAIGIHFNKSQKYAEELTSYINQNFNTIAHSFKADLTNIQELNLLVKNVIKKFGRLDTLVNNASVFISSTIENTNELIWSRTLDTNLKSMFFLSKYSYKYLKKSSNGVIINISSLGGLKPFSKHIAYSVSKAGVIMLTRCLAKALAPEIRVIAIAPGTIKFSEKIYNAERQLLNDYVSAKEVAKMVVSLINDFKHITGECITMESGNLLI